MELNLINKELSDIKYNIIKFNDGEPHFSIEGSILDLRGPIQVKCRIASPEDLYIILQVGDILDRFEFEWNLWISYLMSMRMDRIMDYTRPYSLKIMCKMLMSMKYQKIGVLEAHSDRVSEILGKDKRYIPMYLDYTKAIPNVGDCCIVIPDKGANERYGSIASMYGSILFDKERDLNTGKFLRFEVAKVDNRFHSDTFVFIDDLCDGGGTFLAELQVLKEMYPEGKFGIVVCHAVNKGGIINLLAEFDFVSITNSYKDWDIKHDKLTEAKLWTYPFVTSKTR